MVKKVVKKSWPKPKKAKENVKAEKVVEKAVEKEPEIPAQDGPFCDCGRPVAPGQNSVCAAHIRIG